MIPTAWRKGWSAVATALYATAALCETACRDVPVVQTATATRRSLRVPILADGTLEPLPGREVRAPEAGVIGAIYVREGQRVARGLPLARLDNPDLEQRVMASRSESAQLAEEQRAGGAKLADSDDDAANARARLAAARASLLILRGQLPGQRLIGDLSARHVDARL